MDFSWTQEQAELYTTYLSYARELFSRSAQQEQQAMPWTRKEWLRCGEIGALGLCVPCAYGGKGFGALTTAHILEALGRGSIDTGLIFSIAAHTLACAMPIVEHGSLWLKEHFLPGMCSGSLVGANAITEREAGSDIHGIKTHAVLDGSTYLITGHKSFVSNGPAADMFLVYAVTQPELGHLGLSAFVVKRDTPGLQIGEHIQKMGLTSTPACQITLHECRVPAIQLVGSAGAGAEIFKRSMQWERTCLFALYLGVMERQLELAVIHALKRKQFHKPIIKQQAIAHRLADMKLRLESARLLLYRTCWCFDQGERSMLESALSKLAVSEATIQGGLDCIQIHGALGFTLEANIERMLRDAIPSTIFSGTSEIQRNIIASELEHEYL